MHQLLQKPCLSSSLLRLVSCHTVLPPLQSLLSSAERPCKVLLLLLQTDLSGKHCWLVAHLFITDAVKCADGLQQTGNAVQCKTACDDNDMMMT